MATTSRHLTPWDDPEFEIWCLNESYWGRHKDPDKKPFLKRADRWFQLHPEWDYFRPHNFNHPKHPEWLRNDPWTEEELKAMSDPEDPIQDELLSWGATKMQRRNTDVPIYMLEKNDKIPGSTLYPLDEIINSYGPNSGIVKWFTNSYSYMAALAIHLGFEEIHVYGFEMSSEEEYGHQRACAVFWSGIAIGKGIKLVEPVGCKLHGQHDVLYGYDKIPGITKMHLEISRNAFIKDTQEKQAALQQIMGKKQVVEQQLDQAVKANQKGRINRLKKELEVLLNEQVRALLELNVSNALRQLEDKHIRDLVGMPTPDKIQLIDLPGRIKVR